MGDARTGQARPDQAVILPRVIKYKPTPTDSFTLLLFWVCQRSQSSQAMSMEIN